MFVTRNLGGKVSSRPASVESKCSMGLTADGVGLIWLIFYDLITSVLPKSLAGTEVTIWVW